MHSRLIGGLLSPAPDYVFIAEGTNDASASAAVVTTALAGLLGAIRAAAPRAKLIVLMPPNRTQAAAIAAGMTATSLLVDLGAAGTIGLSGGGIATLYSDADGTHPNAAGQARLGAMYMQAIAAALGNSSTPVSAGSMASSGAFALTQGIFEAA
jgi:lysophospholipase L1-like esterase